MFGPAPPSSPSAVPIEAVDSAPSVALDPVSLILHASGPVFVVVWLLVAAAAAVWVIAVLKFLQLRRWSTAEQAFEADLAHTASPEEMFDLAAGHRDAPGARVVRALHERRAEPRVLPSVAKRALVTEQKTASGLMPLLASIGSASPFVGLFGTVWGIMDAFLRIGREKSASLPVVAPAIGEALIATAIGLFAAIPAVVAYNAIAKRLEDLISGIEASAEGWVALAGGSALAEFASTGGGPGQGGHDSSRGARRSDRPAEATRADRRSDRPDHARQAAAVARGGAATQIGGIEAPTPLPPPEPMAIRHADSGPGSGPGPSWPPPDPFASHRAAAGDRGQDGRGAFPAPQATPAPASAPLMGRPIDLTHRAQQPAAAGPGGTRMGPPPLPKS